MNHYERLKVTRDAPIEVIRAAYRALAAKHHPDRHTQPETSHADMAALNAAYEVLGDPQARALYDAELAPAGQPPAAEPAPRWRGLWKNSEFAQTVMGGATTQPQAGPYSTYGQPADTPQQPADSTVSVSWMTSPLQNPLAPWMNRRRLIPLGAAGGLLLLVVGVWWGRQVMLQLESERALSSHYGSSAPRTAQASPNGPEQGPPLPSDEELLAGLPPALGDKPTPSRLGALGHHPLDGPPLALRREGHLVDPLAPVPVPRP